AIAKRIARTTTTMRRASAPTSSRLSISEGKLRDPPIGITCPGEDSSSRSWSRRAFATEAGFRTGDRRLLRGHAGRGDPGGPVEHPTLIGPHQRRAAAAIDGDRDRVGEIAVSAIDRAEDAIGADSAHMHDAARSRRLIEL